MSNPNHRSLPRRLVDAVAGVAAALLMVGAGFSAETPRTIEPADKILDDCGIPGGLCVEVGCPSTAFAARVARDGRFLVHVLDADPAAVDKARKQLGTQRLYGLASVDRLESPAGLPYSENLINLLVIEDRPGVDVPAEEMVRVLCPGGVVFAAVKKASQASLSAAGLEEVRDVEAGGRWIRGRKPWPAGMDFWTHPRHAADGNAVSRDTLVAPPRRIRWVTGPPQRINCAVSYAGRNFYAGVVARDSFNGLRLWQRSLSGSSARDGSELQLAKGTARPIAAGQLLLAVSDNKLLALDADTGKTVCEYPEAGTPGSVLHVEGTVITVDKASVRALDAQSGRLRWKHEAAEPRYVVAGEGAVYLIQGVPRRGQKCAAVSLDLPTGKLRWQKDDYPFIEKIRRSVYHRGLLAYEISTLCDDGPGNVIHVVGAADGKPLWSRDFVPGMTHAKQARAMFIGDLLWILNDGKTTALDGRTGEVKKTYPAGTGHCYPPVATLRYMFAGEMNLTDLATGQVAANRISKGACGRDAGFMPACGLINVMPKACTCWPMLRGYAALAPARPGGSVADKKVEDIRFVLEKGVGHPNPKSKIRNQKSHRLALLSPRRLAKRQYDGQSADRSGSPLEGRIGWLARGTHCRRLATEPVREGTADAARDRRPLGVRCPARRPPACRPWTPGPARSAGGLRSAGGSTPRRRSTAGCACSVPRAAGCTVCAPMTAGWCGGSAPRHSTSGSSPTGSSNRPGPCREACWSSMAWPSSPPDGNRWPTGASWSSPSTRPAARFAGSGG